MLTGWWKSFDFNKIINFVITRYSVGHSPQTVNTCCYAKLLVIITAWICKDNYETGMHAPGQL